MADKKEPAHKRMYANSPRIEADDTGKKVIKKPQAQTQEEATNVSAGHDAAMLDMTQKHSTERLDLHQRHEKELLELMHKKAATVGGVETE